MTSISNLSPFEIFVLTIIGEARGEPIQGQVAAAWIIKNRMLHNLIRYPTYKEVCLEKSQFSCWDDELDYLNGLMQQPKFTDRYLIQCEYVATGVDQNEIIDNTNGSLYYLTNDLFNGIHRPKWANYPRNVKIIGNQTFFLV